MSPCLQDEYEAKFKAYDPDGNLIGDPNGQVGCIAAVPIETCTIKLDKSQFPPGTKFDVEVVSKSNDVASDPKTSTTHSSKQGVLLLSRT